MPCKDFHELTEVERLIDEGGTALQARVICTVDAGPHTLPVHAIVLGNPDPALPAVGFFGGVHGLERIGSAVVVAYLRSLVVRLRWDATLHRLLDSLRLLFVPIVNPGGMWLGTRANPNGVDLMRNAPLSSAEHVPWPVGGQRLSARLPWFRGSASAMERESTALCAIVEEELLARRVSIALDCHSGFGMTDRVWFPYAHTVRPIPHLADVHALKEVFEQTYRNHNYVFEPQSRQYLAHGDLWDHLYGIACRRAQGVFLPLTLEMGSWLWVKKNPRQILSLQGLFNPLIEHRMQRVLRRHIFLLDFLARCADSHAHWLPADEARARHHARALAHWYPESPSLAAEGHRAATGG